MERMIKKQSIIGVFEEKLKVKIEKIIFVTPYDFESFLKKNVTLTRKNLEFALVTKIPLQILDFSAVCQSVWFVDL